MSTVVILMGTAVNVNMGRAKRYDRETILKILRDRCPMAIAAFPDADAFKFQVLNDNAYLVVGLAMTDSRRPTGMTAWVEVTGPCKPWLYVRTSSKWRLEKDSHRLVQCQGVFGLISECADVYAWSNRMKALVSLVFVYAGHKDEFADFDRGKGLLILIEVLETVAKRAQCRGIKSNSTVQDQEEEEDNDVADSDDGSISSEDDLALRHGTSTLLEGTSTPTKANSSAAGEENDTPPLDLEAVNLDLSEVFARTDKTRSLDTDEDGFVTAKRMRNH